MDFFRWSSLSESALLIELGDRIDEATAGRVVRLAKLLTEDPPPGIVECVPTYVTVTVLFDPLAVDAEEVADKIQKRWLETEHTPPAAGRRVVLPVCYDESLGPDLPFVAHHSGLTVEEVVRIHSSGEYLVHAIGFMPGFPYLGGMSARIAAPRLETPRLSVSAGSVGIAGEQTGIYPLETPGGWRLIGRTPARLFDPLRSPPALFEAGDVVCFRRIGLDEYAALAEKEA